ncbi:thiamine pyrophosphate TPP-binding domain-containing protein [Pelosinus fermentans A11]|uniref:Thiamine pyrophosphate TPP-binding domain-containing protein n=2 Tax=Sporomusaceae TaxID=1843490 RepID=I8RLD3_9FIRM|nr:thiamine pyrophosphate-dependent enzyme [Pelosinus fermentans]EIW19380.1 thiamine pyrophosphate TPP-binding domain-containing protein [Pelosinus fermentans B4]EIW24889.1 thiamine pyrophosphate TPP-binding domain-containing protein [Pelosinus fermentans A11]
MVKTAMEISEEFDTPVMMRVTTRVCHSKSIVEFGEPQTAVKKPYIGCYGLGGADPLNAKDSCICMGAGPSIAHGAQKVFSKFGEKMRAVGVVGDSTFFHTGINSLMTTVYNKSNTITCILDNRITGMTGHQENPGSYLTRRRNKTD